MNQQHSFKLEACSSRHTSFLEWQVELLQGTLVMDICLHILLKAAVHILQMFTVQAAPCLLAP